MDSDSQGSARDWSAAKETQPVIVVGIDRPVLERDIKKQFADTDFVVIDGAPSTKEMAVSAIKAANLVLIPVQPSQLDVWSTADIAGLVRQRQEITDGRLRAAFVISRAIKGTRLEGQVGAALASYEIPVLETVIHQRIAFADSMGAGSTVLDLLPEGQAAGEVLALRDEVLSFLRQAV